MLFFYHECTNGFFSYGGGYKYKCGSYKRQALQKRAICVYFLPRMHEWFFLRLVWFLDVVFFATNARMIFFLTAVALSSYKSLALQKRAIGVYCTTSGKIGLALIANERQRD